MKKSDVLSDKKIAGIVRKLAKEQVVIPYAVALEAEVADVLEEILQNSQNPERDDCIEKWKAGQMGLIVPVDPMGSLGFVILH